MIGPRIGFRLRAGHAAAALALCCGLTAPAAAQPRPVPRPTAPAGPTPRAGSWEISGGVGIAGGYDLGSGSADLTRNTTTGGQPFALFATDSNVGQPTSLLARLGYFLSPRLQVEGGFRYGRPVHRIDISGDTESAPSTEIEQTLDQYVVDASLLWHFPRQGARRSPLLPFVFGGGGYLRELHEGQQLAEAGATYHAGAGFKYWFGTARRRFGLRGEAALLLRTGGFDPEDKVRAGPLAGASLVYLF